ncbi:IS3 family transposase [Salinispora arenicola]|uniref:IS3 family transposase n=1 Tax=Salinispora arenicola TaxID=168697 RepID=UPI0003A69C4E|nr:IS3 family transposase [Salinispora arenicola]
MKHSCELLEVSRSAYYQHRSGPSRRERDDADLTAQIVDIHAVSAGAYGAPWVRAELAAQGRRHSRKRIARLMRGAGLCGRTPKRWRTTTVPDPTAALAADRIRRDFTATASMDLYMMSLFGGSGGRERTVEHVERLLVTAGLRVTSTARLPSGMAVVRAIASEAGGDVVTSSGAPS